MVEKIFKFKKGILKVALLVICLMCCAEVGTVKAEAAVPKLSSSNYMKCYVLSTGNKTPVYMDKSLTTRGTSNPSKKYAAYIYANDEIYVYSMNTTYAYISYPVSNGTRKYGYVKTSAITSYNCSKNAQKATGKITTYRRPGSGSYGTIVKGDTVYPIASSNGWIQIH